MSKNSNLKKRFKVLLCALVSINLLLVGIIYIYEKRTRNLQVAFNALGWCDINDQDRPNYWSLHAWEKCVEKIQYDADVAFFGNSLNGFIIIPPFLTRVLPKKCLLIPKNKKNGLSLSRFYKKETLFIFYIFLLCF